ncbi:MAG: 2OG-Fe dioxygenase family protein [Candidatus Cybelea sp.]
MITDTRDKPNREKLHEGTTSGQIAMPICVFELDELGVSRDFLLTTCGAFYELPWDLYDVRLQQIMLLTAAVGPPDGRENELFRSYYSGAAPIAAIDHLLVNLSVDQRNDFGNIQPFRRRSISRFILTYSDKAGQWCTERVSARNFSQAYGSIYRDAHFDYRRSQREFAETHQDIVENVPFQTLLSGLAMLLKQYAEVAITHLDITCHHTYVEAARGRDGNNSPEGIHQDGYDCIVSALVVDRKDIEGAASQIFDGNGKRLLVKTLQPGQGILQPDKGTDLWHNVTPLSVSANAQKGYRSSIGFDITVL